MHLEAAPASTSADMSAVQNDLQILRDWQAADQEPVVTKT
jgi:hypothetical protein